MSRIFGLLAGLAGSVAIALASPAVVLAAEATPAAQAAPIAVPSGVSYELIGHWDVDKLNQILNADAPKFFNIAVPYTPAKNAVSLYRVTYSSVVPEQNNRPIVATGLLAVPDTSAASFPVMSYQHGTVYLKTQVPSFPDQSPETQLILAQFAGQGYVVIGADYFGMGTSTEPEGYGVIGSQQQASLDMLLASRAVLDQMKIATGKLFIGGWSEGGFVTMAFLERLEKVGVKVDGAATASGPADIFSLLSGFLDFPRQNDATWANVLYILSAFSFENYYGLPGLARTVITDEYYDLAKKVYERQPYKFEEIPADLHKLVRPEYFDAQFLANSAYGKIALATQAYRWIIKTPVRNYYGEADEIVSVGLGKLVMNYQQGIGGGNNKVEAISTGQTDHRGTFATAVPLWKTGFDGE
ncbi:alpha/beta hydrolase [Kaistia algarum]|uniref:alpha/beta hydrolase family protein n=1 Tax=Kaistia algarum TaxID=2083279 RepID=UPI000CE74E74|nr:alpha/beta hydrolase [Kaistia algarum]MCX5514416.1 alpha/beta hydrolase [Kaistia algarum]PPE79155.1 alpha/beta hydrolase [Kaistia algarum]